MRYLHAHPVIGAPIIWEVSHSFQDEPQGITITCGFGTLTGPPNRRSALRSFSSGLIADKIPWFFLRGSDWIVNLDVLKSGLNLPPTDPDLSRLTGEVITVPEYDIEERELFGERIREGIVRLTIEADSLQQLAEPDEDRRTRLFDDRALHPELISTCRRLFVDGHLRQSVLDGCIRVNELVKGKSGLAEDGFALMARAFSKDAPILKFTPGQTNDDKNEQQGYMFLFGGMIQAIRNPTAHALLSRSDEIVALEELGFLSLLLRHLDRSTK